MNTTPLPQMADILLPAQQPLSDNDGQLATIAVLFIVIGFAAGIRIWRWLRDPYRRLGSRLRAGTLPPRTAAHRLAHLLAQQGNGDPALHLQLDRLRFARQPPDTQTLLDILARTSSDA